MSERTLKFATFLAPSIWPVYKAVSDFVGQSLGCATELVIGKSFNDFAEGLIDVGFICGLPYVQLMRLQPTPVELLAAPVLEGERYAGKPIYFSDVIVRADSPYRSFTELRGCSWSYNDRDSQSGYGIVRYRLVTMGETKGYFGNVVEAGFHQESIRKVRSGEVDASAIDSQVLAVEMRDDHTLARDLRIIDSLGPSTIQPVVAARTLPDGLKSDLQALLLTMHSNTQLNAQLGLGMVSRFVAVNDASYDDIRTMLEMAESAQVLELK